MTVVNITEAPKATKQEKLDLYCQGIADGLIQSEAYIAAGYSPHMARQNASKYHRQNSAYITAYLSEHIGSHAPTALKVILKIMNSDEEKGGIRLKAAQDVLDRAGFGSKQKIELTTKDVKDLSTEDLQNEIRKMVEESPELAKVFNIQG